MSFQIPECISMFSKVARVLIWMQQQFQLFLQQRYQQLSRRQPRRSRCIFAGTSAKWQISCRPAETCISTNFAQCIIFKLLSAKPIRQKHPDTFAIRKNFTSYTSCTDFSRKLYVAERYLCDQTSLSWIGVERPRRYLFLFFRKYCWLVQK